ncbi:metallophosphoesterase [Terrimonas sp. NA20]|uniref:Metallophosphoesterase n=1 Tax=Terrimonas ginsenosidimutans TaxID=2908004 RepID=A0ABS9KU24_9BACT|nr:metallophosphoesterase [Terrimonas ginsenosidimutans]MCG2615830.1 metallophosphoesterase [Terrimonas ginsenosidimutans]
MKTTILLLVVLCVAGCKMQYHPSEVRPDHTNLNVTNIDRLKKDVVGDTFSFILVGDTQRFYEQLDDFVSHVNGLPDIRFVLLNGDLVDFGLNKEYNWIAQRLLKLKAPFVATIGNHDMLANGRLIYDKMFGPENFSFYYGNSKFIGLNTNSEEVGFNGSLPDLNFLAGEMADTTARNIFLLSHVSPSSAAFDRNLEMNWVELLQSNPRTRISMHGHDHQYKLLEPYEDGIDYLHVGATGARNYAKITVKGEHYTIEERYY